MTRFLIAIVTLAFFTGCIAPTEQLTPFPEDAEGPSPEEEEYMRRLANSSAFGSSQVIPFVENGASFSPSMSVTMLDVDLSSFLSSENIESEIIRVPGNWAVTVQTTVDYGEHSPTFAPLLATLEFGSGGSRTQIRFNPTRFSQVLVPATNIRLYITWDADLSPYAGNGKEVRVNAFLQRSPFIENRAFKAFGVRTNFPVEPDAFVVQGEIPFGAKSWSFVADTGPGQLPDSAVFSLNNRLEFDGPPPVGHQYYGDDLLRFYEAGVDIPIKGTGAYFKWVSQEINPGSGFLRFNL